ncbi:MAG: hypothetical protein AAFY20_18985 [Cyanobacteria bacterium J06639_14]
MQDTVVTQLKAKRAMDDAYYQWSISCSPQDEQAFEIAKQAFKQAFEQAVVVTSIHEQARIFNREHGHEVRELRGQ